MDRTIDYLLEMAAKEGALFSRFFLRCPDMTEGLIPEHRNLVGLVIVLAVHNEALVCSAKLSATKAAANYLFVQYTTDCWPGDYYMCYARRIKSRC